LLYPSTDGKIHTTKAKEEKNMQDWRSWETGRKTIYEGAEFDGSFHFEGVITEVHDDHLICEAEGMHLWVDDDTAGFFR
jgi:hypothetical protein